MTTSDNSSRGLRISDCFIYLYTFLDDEAIVCKNNITTQYVEILIVKLNTNVCKYYMIFVQFRTVNLKKKYEVTYFIL